MKLARFALPLVVLLSACSSRAPAVAPQAGTTGPPVVYAVPSAQDSAKAEADYVALLAKVKVKPVAADVKRLRDLYVRTKRYQPYGADGFPPDQIFEALDAKKWETCRAEAQKLLDRNYIDMNAHLGAMLCNREDGRRAEADHHDAMLTHLVETIRASGDGKTPKTAFVTYYTPELYAFLAVHGLQTLGQALSSADEDGQVFDIMSVKDRESGKEFSLYFNITWQFGWQATERGGS